MSRSACQISGSHDWRIILDADDWWTVKIVCDECGATVKVKQ